MILKSVDEFRRRAADLGVQLLTNDSKNSPKVPHVRFSIEEVPYVEIALARRFVAFLGDFQD